jgi:hypothetical protein
VKVVQQLAVFTLKQAAARGQIRIAHSRQRGQKPVAKSCRELWCLERPGQCLIERIVLS